MSQCSGPGNEREREQAKPEDGEAGRKTNKGKL